MINSFGQFILFIVTISILGYGFWLAYEPWFKLAAFFETELPNPPEIFFEQRSFILAATRMKGCVNVGVVEQKLYLSHTSPLSNFIKPLLIDLDAITKIDFLDSAPLFNRAYQLYIGKPNITTLILSQELIERLEEEYGEPIFSNKLGELR
ncbi:MAG: hypothetical protein AAFQ80_10455 [Cyanobacteria bacterium J06621_8]